MKVINRVRGKLPFDGEDDEMIKKAIITSNPDYNNANFINLTYNVMIEE